MENNLLVLTIVIIAICCNACTFASGPEKVAEQAIEALQNKDFDSYAATFNLSSSDQKLLAALAEEKINEEISDKGGIKSYKVTDCQINGDEAVICVKIVYRDASEETQRMDFIKTDDTWKQELNK